MSTLAACSRPPTPTIVREVDDAPVRGPFVSPYAYEHFVRAEIARGRGEHEEALEHYRRARAGAADDVLLAARHAETLEALDRRDDADRVLGEARALDGESEAYLLARSRIAAGRGDDADALTAAIDAVRFAPRSSEAVRWLATRLDAGDQAPRAREVLSRSEGTAALRARLALSLRRGDVDAIGEAVEAIVRVAPVLQDDVAAAAERMLAEGHPARAVAMLAQVERGEPALEVLRVRALLAAGRADEARARVVELGPGGVGSAHRAAQLAMQAGDPELAEMHAAAAVANEPAAWVVLGDARLARGDRHGAMRAYARAPRVEAARLGRARVIVAAGLDALAAEVAARPSAL